MTPANACPMNDGAAALLVMTAERAESWASTDGADLGYGFTGVDPAYMGIGPATALPKALGRARPEVQPTRSGGTQRAFAAQALAVAARMTQEGHGWDWDKTNVNGGAIALGHPVGQVGRAYRGDAAARNEAPRQPLRRRSLCVGGGQGEAVVVERL